MMLLGWLRRNDATFDARLREYLFGEGSIVAGSGCRARGGVRQRPRGPGAGDADRDRRPAPEDGVSYLRREFAPLSERA